MPGYGNLDHIPPSRSQRRHLETFLVRQPVRYGDLRSIEPGAVGEQEVYPGGVSDRKADTGRQTTGETDPAGAEQPQYESREDKREQGVGELVELRRTDKARRAHNENPEEDRLPAPHRWPD
jgi:hypothetical protein